MRLTGLERSGIGPWKSYSGSETVPQAGGSLTCSEWCGLLLSGRSSPELGVGTWQWEVMMVVSTGDGAVDWVIGNQI